jgi:hypothetical protein
LKKISVPSAVVIVPIASSSRSEMTDANLRIDRLPATH